MVKDLRTYLASGGNAVVFLGACNAPPLQDAFDISCVKSDQFPGIASGPGENLLPIWNGLTIGFRGPGPGIHLLPGQSSLTCIPVIHQTGPFCAALYGHIGNGSIMFLARHRDYRLNVLSDHVIERYDNVIAASKLLYWLVEREEELAEVARFVAPDNNSVLLEPGIRDSHSHMSAIAFGEGLQVDTASVAEHWGYRNHKQISGLLQYEGLVFISPEMHQEFADIHAYIYAGGNAALFITERCHNTELQAVFGISCVAIPDSLGHFEISGPGEHFAPFWSGLTIGSDESAIRTTVQLSPGQSDLTCIPLAGGELGSGCTALYGKIKDGNVIFLLGHLEEYRRGHTIDTIMKNDYIWENDNNEAAIRLLHWLVETPNSN